MGLRPAPDFVAGAGADTSLPRDGRGLDYRVGSVSNRTSQYRRTHVSAPHLSEQVSTCGKSRSPETRSEHPVILIGWHFLEIERPKQARSLN